MQIEVNIKSGKYLFVAVPKIKGITIVNYTRAGKWVVESNGKELNCWKIKQEDNWKVIQLLSQITEENAKDIVEFIKDKGFQDYQEKNAVCLFVLDSFQSLLKANKIYTKNPFAEPSACKYLNNFLDFQYRIDLKHWQEAKKTVSEEWLVVKILQ